MDRTAFMRARRTASRWLALTGLLAVAACAPGSGDDPSAGTESPAPDALTALFVGDSYTEGVSLDEPLLERWSALVSRELGWTEVNASCNGSGYTRPGLLCGTTFAERLPSLRGIEPDVVVIWGGVNDVGATPEEAASAAAATVTAYARAFPQADLIVVSAMFYENPPPAGIVAVNEALKSALADGAGTFIDLGPMLGDDPTLLGDDGLHPGPAGHRAIAAAVLAALGGRT